MKQSMPTYYAQTAAKHAEKAYLKNRMTKEERARHACDNVLAAYSIATFAAAGEVLGKDKINALQDTADQVDRELIQKAYPQTTARLKAAHKWIVDESKPLMHHTPIHLPTSGRHLNAAERWILGEQEGTVTNSARVIAVALKRAFDCDKETISGILDKAGERYGIYMAEHEAGSTQSITNDIRTEVEAADQETCKDMTVHKDYLEYIVW